MRVQIVSLLPFRINMKEKTINVIIKVPENKTVAGPGDVLVTLSGGENLGLVQALNIKADVNSLPTLELSTFMTETEVAILQKNTEVKVTIIDEKRLGM